MAVQRVQADAFVAIPGYREWLKEVRGVSRGLERVVRVANKEVADEVADAARTRAKAHSKQYAKAAAGIRARGRANAAAIALRVAKYPWIMGAEFGSKRYAQFKPWTGNQWQPGEGPAGGVGYAVYPTIRDMVPEIVDTYGDRVEDVIWQAWEGTGKAAGLLDDIRKSLGQ